MKKKITRLLFGTISEKELIVLRNWLKDPRNRVLLESYVRDYHDLNMATLENNLEEAFNKVSQQIDINEKPVKRFFPNWAKYAAAMALIFGLGVLYHQGYFLHQEQKVLSPKNESITLELENGTIQTIDINGTLTVRDSEGNIIGTQEQSQISYSKVTQKKELVFNTINIPNGKKFELELSDGTLVKLNAGSSLKYPVNFLSEGPRRVFLSGEAYFDVARNESNPFEVNVEELDIKVLGTEFNVSAYSEDEHIDVVLVTGSVGLSNKDQLQVNAVELVPGQKGVFNQDSNSINVEEVNTSLYTSWMRGYLVFRDLTFDNILKKLERHYNIEIENTNTELGKMIFNASFDNVEIEKVLSFFNDTHEIQYEIKSNKILIK